MSKPFTVSVGFTTDRPPAEVHAVLDDLAAHEQWTDHFLVDWERLSEDTRGVGASVRFRAKGAGRHAVGEITVVESTPDRIVEHGRGGKDLARRTTGAYLLEATPSGGTKVTFTNEVFPTGLADRLGAPLAKAYLKRNNAKAMKRLKAHLEGG